MKRKSKKSNPIQAHKIEFYPKKDTQKKLKKLFGYRKYLYNRGLSIQKEMYQVPPNLVFILALYSSGITL